MFQNIIEVLILSAIQGISEFLPISSSAHLILISSLYEFKSSSLLIDISLHLGSLFAIVYYFKEELLNINKNKRLISLIVIGSIPLIIFGYILYTTGLIYSLRNIETIAWTTLIFAIVLYISDKSRFDKKISTNLNIQSILFIGAVQTLIVAILSFFIGILSEEFVWNNILMEIYSILYAGILSGGFAFVLQIYAQKNITPAPAAIIFSLEGVFATVAAWFILNQVLDINNILGCFFILCGVLLSQLLPLIKRKKI